MRYGPDGPGIGLTALLGGLRPQALSAPSARALARHAGAYEAPLGDMRALRAIPSGLRVGIGPGNGNGTEHARPL